MPMPFQPKPRTVVYCDFSGYIPPEMIKRRPVVVLAAHKRNAKLVAVVPLSTTRPNPVEEHHFQLLQNPLADSEMKEVWAKCDMVAVVSTLLYRPGDSISFAPGVDFRTVSVNTSRRKLAKSSSMRFARELRWLWV